MTDEPHETGAATGPATGAATGAAAGAAPGTGADADFDDAAVRRRVDRERRRRQVFGDVLDGSTLDDRPEAGAGSTRDEDRWLRDNVPPHHGS